MKNGNEITLDLEIKLPSIIHVKCVRREEEGVHTLFVSSFAGFRNHLSDVTINEQDCPIEVVEEIAKRFVMNIVFNLLQRYPPKVKEIQVKGPKIVPFPELS